jgi:3-isopropylmalate/(R)-2-methylmalate dehydratase large subunit
MARGFAGQMVVGAVAAQRRAWRPLGWAPLANAFATGAVRMTMAPVLRLELQGALAPGVTAKDVVLHLLALPDIRSGAAVGHVFEFAGPVIRALSTDERATLTNMTAELGGLTGMVEPDAETVLRERGVDFVPETGCAAMPQPTRE